jgi:hypothetical protein
MAAKIRKQVYLDPSHDRDLRHMARASGKTQASIIREALDLLIRDTRLEKERMEARKAERSFIDQWVAKGHVLGHRPLWRRDDLHDRSEPS